MTERELFKAFYRIERVMQSDPVDERFNCFEAQQLDVIYRAEDSGLTKEKIETSQMGAWSAIRRRNRSSSLPSRHSVYIQMLVFTFGRVRRNV